MDRSLTKHNNNTYIYRHKTINYVRRVLYPQSLIIIYVSVIVSRSTMIGVGSISLSFTTFPYFLPNSSPSSLHRTPKGLSGYIYTGSLNHVTEAYPKLSSSITLKKLFTRANRERTPLGSSSPIKHVITDPHRGYCGHSPALNCVPIIRADGNPTQECLSNALLRSSLKSPSNCREGEKLYFVPDREQV